MRFLPSRKDIFRYLVAPLIIAVITYMIGEWRGSQGKKPGFDEIETAVKLDDTRWRVEYEDVNDLGETIGRAAVVEFEQTGSRIVGEGRDDSGRTWIVEGAAAERRVCYIYYDPGGVRLSFGTVIVEMDNAGQQMDGHWTGWSPESGQLKPRKVTLKKLLH